MKAPVNSAMSVKCRATDGKTLQMLLIVEAELNCYKHILLPECGWFYLQVKRVVRSHMEEEAVRL